MQERTNANFSKINFPTYQDAELAGLANFSEFGIFNVIDHLAGGDVTKWQAVIDLTLGFCLLKYSKCAAEAWNEKKMNDYNRSKNK